MAVRYRKDRDVWVAAIEGPLGRETKHFATEQEATQYEMLQSKACLLKLHSICSLQDWGSKDPSQKKRAALTVGRLGVELHPKQVTIQMLDSYVASRKLDGMASSTIRGELSGLKVMLTRAIRLGWLDALPLFPENRTMPLPEPRDLVIKDEWFKELLLQFEKKEQRIDIQVAIFSRQTGCRIDEALSLTWDRVDFNSRQIQFILTKGTNARRLPMNDQVLSVLTARKAHDTEKVFSINYDPFYRHYKAAVKATCKALGLGLQVQKEWLIHTLRHTRITELALNGASAPQIQQWAGHKDLATSQKYIHNSGINLTSLMDC